MQIKDRRAYSTGGRVRGGKIGVGVGVIATQPRILEGEFNILRKTFLLMDNTQGRIEGRVQTPNPEIFRLFLKSEEKEVEKRKRDGGGGGGNY